MFFRRAIVTCAMLFTYGTVSAQTDGVEGCHFEMVDHNVTLVESFGWGNLFFQDTPYEEAISEMIEELDEELGSNPEPGYYQI